MFCFLSFVFCLGAQKGIFYFFPKSWKMHDFNKKNPCFARTTHESMRTHKSMRDFFTIFTPPNCFHDFRPNSRVIWRRHVVHVFTCVVLVYISVSFVHIADSFCIFHYFRKKSTSLNPENCRGRMKVYRPWDVTHKYADDLSASYNSWIWAKMILAQIQVLGKKLKCYHVSVSSVHIKDFFC